MYDGMRLGASREILGIVVLLAVLAQGAAAVSVAVPSNLADVLLQAGDSRAYSFNVRGDNQTEQVEFFFTPDPLGGVTIGNEQQYTQTMTLGPYELRNVNLVMNAVSAGTYTVTWGYRYMASGSGSIGITQVVRQKFKVTVNGTVQSSSSSSSGGSGGSSGGGGGGGSGYWENVSFDQPVNNATNATKAAVLPSTPKQATPPSTTNTAGNGVTAQAGAGTKPVMPETSMAVGPTSASLRAIAKRPPTAVVVVFFGLLLMSALFQVATIRALKQEGVA